jgi:type 1 glutamine amidotransferase
MFRRALLLGASAALLAPARAEDHTPIKLLIITGDHVGHDWKATTAMLREFLAKDGHIAVDVTSTPAKDLTPEKLGAYDVLLLNYRASKEPPADTTWTDANKAALVEAVKGGKGLVVFHFASSAFTDWPEYETMTCGGWRTQGFHGPKHEFTVKETDVEHPITAVAPSSFNHVIDELYSNSLMVPGNVVLATAYCDPSKDRGTGKDEPVIWVNAYGKGRVYHNALGHDTTAIADPVFQDWMRWGTEWAATGSVCVPEAAAK